MPSELISKIRQYNPNIDESLIQKAFIFSKSAHGSQKRHSGEAYFSHPLAVASILIELKLDDASIVTALLHDVVEDTEVTLEEIEKEFGSKISQLVDGVTKLGKIESIPSNERAAEDFRKLTVAMSQDIRVLIVKLADRLHNMRTLTYVPSQQKKLKKAQETLSIYAPLAGRIGFESVKLELQELAFEIIDPNYRHEIIKELDELRKKNQNLITKINQDLESILAEEKINCEVSGREKTPYSIWLKMRKTNVGFHNLNDIMAFRIICEDVKACYNILGIVNSYYNMIPGTFKDYISTPKENGYQSLHLAILGPFNKKIEVQIRDKTMHEISEMGVAAHWRYKESNRQSPQLKKKSYIENEQYRWVRDLVDLFKNSENASDVLKNHKLQMHHNEVFCFTPDGDIFKLPLGATVIDFAYEIHSEIGNKCVAAKVNGVISPLRYKIENGDQIEITTDKNSKPSPHWLQFIVTSKARTAIKNFIRSEKFEEYSNLGRAILNKFFASKNLEINDTILEKILNNFNCKAIENLCARVAEGSINRHEILKIAYPEYKEENKSKKSKNTNKKYQNNDYLIPIEGLVSGMAINYGGCCNPILGDPIIGVINTGTGVTIHNQNCKNLKNMVLTPQRIIDICWKSEEEVGQRNYSSKIRIIIQNQSGSLADVSSIISQKNVNINSIRIASRSANYLELLAGIEVKNVDHLEEIFAALRISKKIAEVERVYS